MPEGSGKHPHAAPHSQERGKPAVVEIMDVVEEIDMPFEEGAGDTLDPDLRHRMVSEAAYYSYAQRGYADGYEFDDWLQAEAQVDHVAVKSDGTLDEATGKAR